MSLRLNGSVLGKRNVPTATLATGAWSLRAQSLYRRDNIWPRRDPDAVAFAATSGATDIDAISDFVKGVKRLGLWDDMVCWPLRSTQNAGTGTTAYSLGGMGTFNGTLVNGPTWGADGIELATNATTGRDRSITVTWSSAGGYDIRSNSTVFSVSDFGEVTGQGSGYDQWLFGGGATANERYGGVNTRNSNSAGFATINGPGTIGFRNYTSISIQTIASAWRTWATQRENNLVANTNVQGNKLWREVTQIANGSNAAQVGFEAIANASDVIVIGNGRGNTSLAPVGKISFTAIFADWTVSIPALRDLYKATLGTGLGLP
jgi:hypothetical protein